MASSKIDWIKELRPLLKKYNGRKHPLNYNTIYEMLVMTILAARDSDRRINEKALELFKLVPNMTSLSQAKAEDILPLVIPQKDWGNVGMGLSFLGREICRPQKPKCEECLMNKICRYYLGGVLAKD